LFPLTRTIATLLQLQFLNYFETVQPKPRVSTEDILLPFVVYGNNHGKRVLEITQRKDYT